MTEQTIILTGGGTAGHVSLNQAVLPELQKLGFHIEYIGSKGGIEQEIIGEAFPNTAYHAISSGKIRRYFSRKNFTDPFRVGGGLVQSLGILRRTKPAAIFSKGGFVSVPVVMAGRMMKIPVIIHESDVTPGLANKIAMPFADHIYTVFNETLAHVPAEKATASGAVIRDELLTGSATSGKELCGFNRELPVLLIMGGSQGSALINQAIRSQLEALTARFNIIHLCGKGNTDPALADVAGYRQFDYVTTELPDLLHYADYIVSRAGSNSIFEFLALEKPMLLIPLSKERSRGDQLLNAELFRKQGFARVLEEEELTADRLSEELVALVSERETFVRNMEAAPSPKTAAEMAALIAGHIKKR
ncbi:undecaprenyldiphospho-muramoylpentapeptide beta-N-acetylglucosaminyltransferase [Planococcus lenghuensis]|uniref:UDP-N-acetylglucosamine--N-acetylmuramyl-(pentapeptide) pyrophosphoryl-undecaprenol N-acetylglucosamine transferase n=1 Tax=Planococcus lenghuensis TaxID=2213202 RepID=A0A1Q2L3U2_9BACL|nr:undecaprenyldiphospho-muramoylpentapeptide beta-N-acetylglucosaminyltransferase [Planococcus lenghuensis]AQQ55091.1 undecaprenyldiphospho-muramoylpentapeptide beta-N-acetylglucosaminyltransferase [Planococcus lenghuensis]